MTTGRINQVAIFLQRQRLTRTRTVKQHSFVSRHCRKYRM